jgi:hypothetical protein
MDERPQGPLLLPVGTSAAAATGVPARTEPAVVPAAIEANGTHAPSEPELAATELEAPVEPAGVTAAAVEAEVPEPFAVAQPDETAHLPVDEAAAPEPAEAGDNGTSGRPARKSRGSRGTSSKKATKSRASSAKKTTTGAAKTARKQSSSAAKSPSRSRSRRPKPAGEGSE